MAMETEMSSLIFRSNRCPRVSFDEQYRPAGIHLSVAKRGIAAGRHIRVARHLDRVADHPDAIAGSRHRRVAGVENWRTRGVDEASQLRARPAVDLQFVRVGLLLIDRDPRIGAGGRG